MSGIEIPGIQKMRRIELWEMEQLPSLEIPVLWMKPKTRSMWSILPSTLTILTISLESTGKKDFARVKSIKIIVDSPNISPREGEDPKGRGNKRGVGCRSASLVTRFGVEGVGWVGQIQGRIRRVSLKLKHLGVQDIRGKGIAERLPRTGQALLCGIIEHIEAEEQREQRR
ncbi:hypothetical protein AMTR_s00046p00212970 [Amborella trichopoda]|uniref:Uncharacterized protein n=1 Tax=Amborella trichopoda TaxID=13333 RepID=U5D9H0_AMBTC|nr:hypothetical protein AMTR_s00046p00212970 [Amborella trichopoda]